MMKRTTFEPAFTLTQMEALGSTWASMSPAAVIAIRADQTWTPFNNFSYKKEKILHRF